MTEVVLVTGASSGVGEALAPLLAARGYRVYGMSRRAVDLKGVISLPADVTDARSLVQSVDRIIAETGRLDAVLHCAGIGGAGPVEQMPTERARQIMETNFWGSWNLCQATIPHLRKSPRGRLVLVGSIAGFMGIPFRSAYCASKAALKTMTDSLRMELKGTNLQATMVAPGDIATNSIATQYRQPAEDLDPVYQARYRKADDGMAANVNHGMDAGYVAEEIYKIMNKDTLDPYYVVGEFLQRASTVASRWLPGRVWERVLGRYYS
ncbi:SDR family oxidoreductase [Neolewinella antarctica]|uniref:NAD(P)-dependent dehydrogenase (Short-subunit alcohol dehydrogenase family) n=1 Tax=Neolewinella antarctica TaxID=442734 RepID=A0ABX0XEN0_9BACT|nr:SDR family oxidoreductase [Neolewinella antarctica]NJC27344.1 NAD(P)-dependent dehydrogenase (short-subunit alcohol dehydrogenase family) [Neolewinella antarctica]